MVAQAAKPVSPLAKRTAASVSRRAEKMPVKPPKVSPADRAVAVSLREQAGGSVKGFYAERGFWPVWTCTGRIGAEADALLAFLADARLDGLNPDRYDLDELRVKVGAARAGGPEAVAAADLALSEALARYVADVRRPGEKSIKYLDAELKPHKLKPTEVLRAATLPTSFNAYVTGMGWMSPHYLRLRQALATATKAGSSVAILSRLRLNLDRARLLPGAYTRHIVVDAASARLFYYQGGKQQGVMRVVVGTAQTQTPMLAGMVRYAILNPYWNVPVDLVEKKVAPKILAGQTLAGLRFEALTDWTVDAGKLDPAMIDWRAVAAGKREVRVRQLPGPANAMGKVKFMFPNDLGIYLHDTSERALLTKPDRHFSNGCVRLEDAPRLGRWLLGKPLAAAGKRPEQIVPLAQPVPVYLTYLTATPTAKSVGFLRDVYERDGAASDR